MSRRAHDKKFYVIKGKAKDVRYLKRVKVPAKALEANPGRSIYEFRIVVKRFLRELTKKTHYGHVFSVYIPFVGTVHTHGNKIDKKAKRVLTKKLV